MGDGGFCYIIVAKLLGVSEPLTVCCLDVANMCAVVLWRCGQLPSIDRGVCPRAALVCLLMHFEITSHWCQWHIVIIEWSAEMVVG